MRISELDDIEKEVLLGAVVKRIRNDLNGGRPLSEMRSGRDYCSACEASLTSVDHKAQRCTQCNYSLTESEEEG